MIENTNIESVIRTARAHCFNPGTRVYDDIHTFNEEKCRRLKLSGSRIPNEKLIALRELLVGSTVLDDKKYTVFRVDRNVLTTGGNYTSPEELCIYLKEI